MLSLHHFNTPAPFLLFGGSERHLLSQAQQSWAHTIALIPHKSGFFLLCLISHELVQISSLQLVHSSANGVRRSSSCAPKVGSLASCPNAVGADPAGGVCDLCNSSTVVEQERQSVEDMAADMMASVATGAMASVIDKMTSLLGGEYGLTHHVKSGIRSLSDELSSMNALLQRLADIDDDQIDVQTKEWRSKVIDLSYDIEDCVDRFFHLQRSRKAEDNFVKTMVRKIKELWEDRQIAKEIQQLKALVVEQKEQRDRYNVDECRTMARPVLLDPRAPTMYEQAMDLVGIEGPCEKIIGWLKGEERQLKVVSIFGSGGLGKTTLAMEVYRNIDEPFDCRASVTVSRSVDIKKLLRDLLFQVNRSEYHISETWEIEQLIPTLREQLLDKR